MKANIEDLIDSFKVGYDTFRDSRLEADKVEEYYHNRQFTDAQLAALASRGQPAETFNVVKAYSRMLIGYFSTVVNDIKVIPTKFDNSSASIVLNDVVKHVLRVNQFDYVGDSIKLDAFLSGLFCVYLNVVATDERDEFGRIVYTIELEHVPSYELVLDPMSRKADYSDARYIHRFKWLSEETCKAMFGAAKFKELEAYHNHLEIAEAEFEYRFNERFTGKFRVMDNYLIVHSIVKEENGNTYSVYWSGNTILNKKKITYKEVKFPYRVVKLNDSSKAEYYGIFREVLESQDAINQAVLQIQLLANTNKVLVEEGAVENTADFEKAYSRVSAIIPVLSIGGIKVENLSGEVQQQYMIVDKALARIQRVLGINDSFLGMAFASDSGRKVQLQQNSSIVALRYISKRLETFLKLLGMDLVKLIKQYYRAHQMLALTDEMSGIRWAEINAPLRLPTGKVDAQGMPIMDYVYEEVIDPETGKPMLTEDKQIVFAPVNEAETSLANVAADIEIFTAAYNDEDDRSMQVLESMLQGNMGMALQQVNPAAYFQAAAMLIRAQKAKHSEFIAELLMDTAQQLGGPQVQPQGMQALLGGMPDASSQLPGRGTSNGV